MNWDDMAVVGRVARAHGLRGQVVINVETDFPGERFQPGTRVFVRRHGDIQPLTMTSVRFHRERPVVALSGVETIDEAEDLAGSELRVPAEELAPLPDGMFYRHDLVGCRVEMLDGRPLGVVTGVEGEISGSRLVVDTAAGQVLVPLADAICPTVDPAHKRIVIDPPGGLLDLNENR